MAAAMKKAKTMPDLPPMALPMKTMRMVRRERRKVVFSLFIAITSDDYAWVDSRQVVSRGNKKDLYPGSVAWIKVLLADFCPGPGSFDRIDGIRVDLFSGR